MLTLTCIVALTLTAAADAASALLPLPELPALPWTVRSDWLLVTEFGAVGDGKTDDTAAINAAFAAVVTGNNATLYFPPGVYLISDVVTLNTSHGVALIGAGRDTVLRWTGPACTPNVTTVMVWSAGNTRALMEGFVLDGAGTAGVGLDHRSESLYESRFVHRNLRFTNFTVAGIRVGLDQYAPGHVASAEMPFYNVLWDSNAAGVQLLSWNDYDNLFSGCLFWGNGYGVQGFAGNFYIHNTRFEASTVMDVLLTGHANSLRRVVSVGSAQFLGSSGNSITKVHQAMVYNWGSANYTPAIVQQRGPIHIIDSVFSSPVNASSSAMAGLGSTASVFLSNVSMLNAGPVLDPSSAAQLTHLYEIPFGDPKVAAMLPYLDQNTQFFQSTWPMPGAIFDAVEHFGADKTGHNVSQDQITACIAAAAAANNRSMCYLPTGTYIVNATLSVCGSNFILGGGGSGFSTVLRWASPVPASGVVMATGPGAGCAQSVNITIQHLNAFTAGSAGVLDFAATRSSTVPGAYNRLFNETTLTTTPADAAGPIILYFDSFYFQSNAGAVLNGLTSGDVVYGPHWDGNLAVIDSDDAVIIPTFLCLGANGVLVQRTPAGEGTSSGFLGVHSLIAASNAYDIWLYNSSSFVATDHYTETSHSNILLSGDGVSGPGRAAIAAAKMNTNNAPWGAFIADNYAGAFFHFGAIASYSSLNVTASGTAAARLTLAGEQLWVNETSFTVDNPNVQLTLLGNTFVSAPNFLPDSNFTSSYADVAAGFDGFRQLAAWDIALNYN